MKTAKISGRGTLLTFADNISVYLIRTGEQRYVLCDTHCGPLSMAQVKQFIGQERPEIVIFNSHSDWDHVWGNCAFEGSLLIAQEQCRQRLLEIGTWELAALPEYHQGAITIVPPNITFAARMRLVAEDVEFIHAPGHTADSAVCVDRLEQIMYIGDLAEEPFPYLADLKLGRYLLTLEWILQQSAQMLITAHSGIVTEKVILANMNYIKAVAAGDDELAADFGRLAPEVHRYNLNNRLFLRYESYVREQEGNNFEYSIFRGKFPDLHIVEPYFLRQSLAKYYGVLPRERQVK